MPLNLSIPTPVVTFCYDHCSPHSLSAGNVNFERFHTNLFGKPKSDIKSLTQKANLFCLNYLIRRRHKELLSISLNLLELQITKHLNFLEIAEKKFLNYALTDQTLNIVYIRTSLREHGITSPKKLSKYISKRSIPND